LDAVDAGEALVVAHDLEVLRLHVDHVAPRGEAELAEVDAGYRDDDEVVQAVGATHDRERAFLRRYA
jgi:hypothetical protein